MVIFRAWATCGTIIMAKNRVKFSYIEVFFLDVLDHTGKK